MINPQRNYLKNIILLLLLLLKFINKNNYFKILKILKIYNNVYKLKINYKNKKIIIIIKLLRTRSAKASGVDGAVPEQSATSLQCGRAQAKGSDQSDGCDGQKSCAAADTVRVRHWTADMQLTWSQQQQG
jgi:hypothetical protein